MFSAIQHRSRAVSQPKHNKRIKVMAYGHSTRKTLRVLLAPYARR